MSANRELNEEDLRLLLEKIVEVNGLRNFCAWAGIDPGNASKIINRKKPMQKKIANTLGFIEVKRYVPALPSKLNRRTKSG